MAFDTAHCRGLYPTLGDGWVYLNAHEGAQIPGRVAAGVSHAMRRANRATLAGLSGRATDEQVARQAVADLVDATPDRVVLGPNKQMLIRTLADALANRMRQGSSVILPRYDDPMVTEPFVTVARRQHATLRYADPDLGTGRIPSWQFKDLVNGSTRLVVAVAAHPLIGTLTNIPAIAEKVKTTSRAWFVVDASALAGTRPINANEWGADIIIVDLGVIGGPQLAALILRDQSMYQRIQPVNPGADPTSPQVLELGPLPAGLTGGVEPLTEHLASLAGDPRKSTSARSQRIADALNQVDVHLHFLTLHAIDGLSVIPGVHIVGMTGEAAGEGAHLADRAPRISFIVHGVSPVKIRQELLRHKIVVGLTPFDPLLDAMGTFEAGGAVTVAMAPFNTVADIDRLTDVIADLA